MRVPDPDRRNLLDGKVCLVTGGGGSLGLATARLFLKEGARVVLVDREPAALATVSGRLDDVNVMTLVADVTSEDDVASAVSRAVERHGRLDVLVGIAGSPAVIAPVTELDVEAFDATLAVHVRGDFLLLKHGLPVLADGGAAVLVSGVAGLRGAPGVALAAAQQAQVGLMRAVAREVASRRIRVNTLHPGPVANRHQAEVAQRLAPVLGGKVTALLDEHTPLGRHAEPEEVAASVLYLASKQSTFTTGTALVVDGGLTI